MAATKPCPPLPFELWGKVLSNIDDPFDLWTTCRQISNGIRIEAERTFRLRFLPDLRIEWIISRDNRYWKNICLEIRVKPSHALVDATSSSATFTIQVKGPVSSTSSGYVDWSNKERNECVRQAFHYKDHNATTRTSEQPFAIIRHKTTVFFETPNVFATYQIDPEISGLSIYLTPVRDQVSIEAWEDQGHISFDWKKLMTSFFSEEAVLRNIERYYIAPRGLENESLPKLAFHAYVHVKHLHDIRVWSVEDFAEKYWRKEVGAVWHTITEDGSGLIPDSDSEDDR
ncbi:hypothetical protein HBH92_067890 [Parastagonospora nodorum]|nr:hypothetical protein HBH92_067890 [Parastagonospora nodorum]KAH4444025.1 hypothetical protein HBH93_066770 [Parastagonospora nodorum]KAH4456315.1 hypothetical protein HBH91_097280 [Parastagonospora nodorum]KAH4493632.1 hypothetical protein HBH89_159740 [Parastagonospora nodorum]KAH4545656.1 hypothetical protein HBH85_088400 [Parastagonospora nodorum]